MNRRESHEYDQDQEPEEQEQVAEPLRLVDQLLGLAPDRDPARPLLYRLRRQLMEREISFQEARRALVEMEAALEKVTAPANRVGIFLGMPGEGIATVFVGSAEYYANIDPRVDAAQLKVGCRVLVNEAYAVVGNLGHSPSGPVAKVGDLLAGGRLRITQAHGTQEVVVERAAELADEDLQIGDEVRMDPAYKVALEVLQSAESKEYFIEDVLPTPWESIGGQAEAIARPSATPLNCPRCIPNSSSASSIRRPRASCSTGLRAVARPSSARPPRTIWCSTCARSRA